MVVSLAPAAGGCAGLWGGDGGGAGAPPGVGCSGARGEGLRPAAGSLSPSRVAGGP